MESTLCTRDLFAFTVFLAMFQSGILFFRLIEIYFLKTLEILNFLMRVLQIFFFKMESLGETTLKRLRIPPSVFTAGIKVTTKLGVSGLPGAQTSGGLISCFAFYIQ